LTVNSDISLDDFETEPGGIGSDLVLVGDILARGVPIRWDEAVALLQETIELVTGTGGDSATVPAFEDVIIDKQGAVRVQSTRRGERGPVAAGRALHTLLATADVPLPLRLFVTQANAPETHASLRAFADALAYFGKPGRAELIRALYERHRASAPAVTPTTPRPVAPTPPKGARADQQPTTPRRTLPQWLIPAAVVVAVVGLAATLWFAVLGSGRSGNTSLVAQAKAAIDTAKAALETSPRLAEPTTRAQPEKPDPTARSRAQSSPAAKAPPSARAVITTTPDLRAALVEPALTLSRPAKSTTPEPTEAAVPVVSATREYVVAPRENATTTIYSPTDVDVQPPVMIYPSLPPPVFVARNAEAVVMNRMELVVAADGSVERVRLLNGPTRMPDMMLLSGAKLWKFSPAVKDGVAVRYRTTVTWSGFP
jgi:hypothetical protein